MPRTPSTSSRDAALKGKLNAALAHGRDGRHQEGIDLLLALVATHPESGPLLGVLGKLYFEAGDLTAAAKWFRKTTQVSPDSELASVGLFHSLWNGRHRSPALAEAARFLAGHDSDEYSRILRELTVAGELSPRRQAAGAA